MIFYNFIIIYLCHLPERKCSDSSADISSDETESGDEDNSKKLKKVIFFINHVLCIPVFMFNKYAELIIVLIARWQNKETKIFQAIYN